MRRAWILLLLSTVATDGWAAPDLDLAPQALAALRDALDPRLRI